MSGGLNTFRADKMQLDGSLVAADGLIALVSQNSGQAIDLGSTSDDAANTLELSDAELDRITARTLRIGDSLTGAITISLALTPTGTSRLRLQNNSTVSQSAAIEVPELAVTAHGTIDLYNVANIVTRVALFTSSSSSVFKGARRAGNHDG